MNEAKKLAYPVPVVVYHHVNTETPTDTTAPEVFRRHMAWLAGQGYRSLSLAEFEAAVEGRHVGPKRILLSFDDGSADLPHCAGVLQDFGFSGVAFLATGLVGQDARCLTWGQVTDLSASGIIEFQSHSHTHGYWDFSDADEKAIAEDLAMSREVLSERLAAPASSFRHLAWPWGRCSPDAERRAEESGFVWQYLVQNAGVTRAGERLRLPRMCADGLTIERFRVAVSLLANAWSVGALNMLSGMVRRARHGIAYG